MTAENPPTKDAITITLKKLLDHCKAVIAGTIKREEIKTYSKKDITNCVTEKNKNYIMRV